MKQRQRYPPRRKIRLPRSVYDGPGVTAMVTIGVRDREQVFTTHPFAVACVEELRRTMTASEAAVLSYCFMPDHVHAVLRLDGSSNLVDVIRLFKGRTSRIAPDFGILRRFWQPSFYDHLVRPDEDSGKYIRYVLENPVRAELVDRVDSYSFVGTFEFDVPSLEHLIW